MAEYMTLLGAEGVRSGGHACERAASTMQSAAASIDMTMTHHSQRMDQWLCEFRDLVERMEKAQSADGHIADAMTRPATTQVEVGK